MLATKTKINGILKVLLFLTIFTLFFPKENINSISIILLGVFLLAFGKINFLEAIKDKGILLLSSLFFISIYGFIISEDKEYALKIVQRCLPFLIFPIVFSSKLILSINQSFIKKSLVFSCLAASIYCQVSNLFYWRWVNSFSTNDFSIYEYFSHHWFTYSVLTKSLNLHPVYFSLFILVSMGFIIEYLLEFKNKKKYKVLIAILISVYFILFLFQLSSKMAVLGILLLLGYFFYRVRVSFKVKILILIASMGVLILLVKFSRLSYRFEEMKQNMFKIDKKSEEDINSNIKKLRVITFNAFLDQKPDQIIFGQGTGDVQSYLDLYYEEKIISKIKNKENDWELKGLNFHNQYLQTFAETGIIGVSSLLLIIFVSFKLGIKERKKEHLLFILLCSLFFLTESFLIRHKGIVFFALFNSFFVLRNRKLI